MTRKQTAEERYKYLTETPVPSLIVRLSIPSIISMIIMAVYNAADTFFVGRISTEATAAVGISFSMMAVIQAFGFFFGQGSGNYLSRRLGAGKHKEAEEMASTGLFFAMITGIIFAAVTIAFLHPLVSFLGAKGNTVTEAENYLRIIFLGSPVILGLYVLNNQLRYQGSAFYAMTGLLSGAIINIIIDPFFIFTLKMGVTGAALATVIGQIISFSLLLIGSSRGANIFPKIKNVRFNRHYTYEIINGGIPALFRQGLAAIAALLLNRAAGLYGNAAIAGMSITTRVMMFVSSALIGFGQGYQPVCSFNYGAGKKERVRHGYFFCLRHGSIFLSVMAVFCVSFAPQIIRFFRNDSEVVAVGSVALRFQACVLPLLATIVISNMMLQAIEKGAKASVTSSARSGIFFIPIILIFPRLFGLFGVEISQAIADLLSIAISIPLAASELKKMKAE